MELIYFINTNLYLTTLLNSKYKITVSLKELAKMYFVNFLIQKKLKTDIGVRSEPLSLDDGWFMRVAHNSGRL